ncbi:MAG: RNA polymerase Rpb4 family protein [Methanomassiliicoccaceae archaeon]|jgi:DNA-directed RNA polymerase subunit F|nr:RNA polymerase Rpb4 family protein [Methanomassiliicoccaceae archaeon]
MAERYVGLAEVKEMLDAESNKRELGTAQTSAMEHSRSMVSLSVSDIKSLVTEVKTLSFMTEYAAYKIGDILPKYPEDVRAIFSKERVTLSADDVKQIIEIVGKYL